MSEANQKTIKNYLRYAITEEKIKIKNNRTSLIEMKFLTKNNSSRAVNLMEPVAFSGAGIDC